MKKSAILGFTFRGMYTGENCVIFSKNRILKKYLKNDLNLPFLALCKIPMFVTK